MSQNRRRRAERNTLLTLSTKSKDAVIFLGCSATTVSQTTLLSMVTTFAYMADDDGQIWESTRSHCVAKPCMDPLNTRKWPLYPFVLSRGKTARIFRRSLTFGKMLSACCLSVRRPRWVHNPTLPVASSGSFIETAYSWLLKDDGKGIRWPHLSSSTWASSRRGSRTHTDGFHKRVPKAHTSWGDRRSSPPGSFLDFLLPQVPSFLGFWIIQTGYWQVFNLEFFSI